MKLGSLCGVLALAAVLAIASGCARRIPASELGEEGGDVEIRLTTAAGEQVGGRLVSLSSSDVVVDALYAHGGDVSIEGTPDRRRVVVDGRDVDGQVLAVERTPEGRAQATVRRTFSLNEITSAEIARSRREATLGTLISQVAGPAIGLLLGLLVQG